MRGKHLLRALDFYVGSMLILLIKLFTPKRSAAVPGQAKQILVFKLAALGDTLLLMPSLQAISKHFAGSRITLVGTSINRDIVRLFPDVVQTFVEFDPSAVFKHPLYIFRFLKKLRSTNYQIIIDFEQWSFVTPLISRCVPAELRIGFKIHKPIRHWLYDKSVERSAHDHEADNFYALAQALGVKEPRKNPCIDPTGPQRGMFMKWMGKVMPRETRRIIVIHPGCGGHGFPREWPIDRYIELCKKLGERSGTFFVFTGSGVEEKLTAQLSAVIPNSTSWGGRDLDFLIGLIGSAHLFISGNNGIMHLAAALGTPQIALHGPTNAAKWGPLSRKAVVIKSKCPHCPCLDLGHEYHRTDGYCMEQIQLTEVEEAATHLLTRFEDPTNLDTILH